MRRILLRLSYAGCGFCGSARQVGVRTVQGELEKTLKRLQETGETFFASRTDAGVHALDAPVAVDVEKDWQPQRLLAALNAHLPEDVRVWAAEEVPSDYNPRYRALRKRYDYLLFVGVAPAAWSGYVYCVREKLDFEGMFLAARRLVGTHDLGGVIVSQNRRAVWTIERFWLEKVAVCGGEVVRFCLEGKAFGYKMVRSLCGLVVEVGRGVVSVGEVEDVASGRRGWRRVVLPPQGLWLVRVDLEGVKCGWLSSPISTPIWQPLPPLLRI